MDILCGPVCYKRLKRNVYLYCDENFLIFILQRQYICNTFSRAFIYTCIYYNRKYNIYTMNIPVNGVYMETNEPLIQLVARFSKTSAYNNTPFYRTHVHCHGDNMVTTAIYVCNLLALHTSPQYCFII